MTTEKDCIYMSSRGLLKSSTCYSIHPISSSTIINYSTYTFSTLKEGDSIYICGSALQYFISHIFNKLNKKFVLITGDCDLVIPNDVFSSHATFKDFIDNEKIIHWFSQNLVFHDHNKLTSIPIGLDYHTLNYHTLAPTNQEKQLLVIKNHGKPFWERKIKCYSNFHFLLTSRFGYDRRDAIKFIPKCLVFFEPNKANRHDSWKKQTEYAFVISPHGNGLDCHRTWEALCLGCIPIVKTSRIDNLYQQLPVLIINSWDNVTCNLLSSTIETFKKMHNENKFDYKRLTLEYWLTNIKSKQ